MQRNKIHKVIEVLQNDSIPLGAGFHGMGTASAGNQANRRVDAFHQLRGFHRLPRIFFRRHMADLPIPVHLVSETPIADFKGFFPSVLDSSVRPIASRYSVTIFDKLCGFLRHTRTEIDAHHDFRPRAFCPIGKFENADFVGFELPPREIELFRAFFFGTDTIFPTIPRNKISARITNDRDL